MWLTLAILLSAECWRSPLCLSSFLQKIAGTQKSYFTLSYLSLHVVKARMEECCLAPGNLIWSCVQCTMYTCTLYLSVHVLMRVRRYDDWRVMTTGLWTAICWWSALRARTMSWLWHGPATDQSYVALVWPSAYCSLVYRFCKLVVVHRDYTPNNALHKNKIDDLWVAGISCSIT